MEKNWLIRTHSNQILGPVSKEKVIELFNKSALSELDEVCSGNGYWFFVREKDLVQRFIYGHENQGFNPVTETVTVLSAVQKDRHASSTEMHEVDDITNMVKLDSKQGPVMATSKTNISEEIEIDLYPKDDDLAFPDMESPKGALSESDKVKKK